MAVTDWEDDNSRFLGLVSVGLLFSTHSSLQYGGGPTFPPQIHEEGVEEGGGKLNWIQFTTDTEAAFSDIQPPDIHTCFCLHTSMTLASGGSPIFPLVIHQPTSLSIWPAVQSLQRGMSTNSLGRGAYVGAVEEMMCVMYVNVTKGA